MAIIRTSTVENVHQCVGEDESGNLIAVMPYTKPQHRPLYHVFIVVT